VKTDRRAEIPPISCGIQSFEVLLHIAVIWWLNDPKPDEFNSNLFCTSHGAWVMRPPRIYLGSYFIFYCITNSRQSYSHTCTVPTILISVGSKEPTSRIYGFDFIHVLDNYDILSGDTPGKYSRPTAATGRYSI
jgi:hypothetical protein